MHSSVHSEQRFLRPAKKRANGVSRTLSAILTISVLQAYCAVTTEYGIPSNFVRKLTESLQIKISTAQLHGFE